MDSLDSTICVLACGAQGARACLHDRMYHQGVLHHKWYCTIIMVPVEDNFTTATSRGNHKAGEMHYQTSRHYRFINLWSVKRFALA